jgi:hypothetical protein
MRTGWIWAGAALVSLAATAAPAAPEKQAKDADPNREVCKSRPVIGSRLARVRECHTAQQWEEMRAQERLGMLRKQYNGEPGCQEGCQSSTKDVPW